MNFCIFLSLQNFFIFLFSCILLFSNQKSSADIQRDINIREKSMQSLRDEIKNIEEQLIIKNKEAISNTEILIDLEHKITLTEKLIRSLNKEEKFISSSIYDTKQQISKLEFRLEKLKNQLKQRLQYLYLHGRPSMLETVLLAANWNSAIYRIKYLDILAEHEKKLRKGIKEILHNLEDKQNKLVLEWNLKTKLLDEQKSENTNLGNDQEKRKIILSKVKKDKGILEKKRSEKEKIIAEITKLIQKLYADKDAMKKREEELARIRAEQHRATTGNFAKMRGKLAWPVKGQIIDQFGAMKNSETGTITENVGIDIQVKTGAAVNTVLDGVVSTITYIRGHGNVIIIDHGGGFSTVYAHIDNIIVNENEYIQMGNPIAYVAAPEQNEISKLHFEVWGNQEKLNPEIWLTRE